MVQQQDGCLRGVMDGFGQSIILRGYARAFQVHQDFEQDSTILSVTLFSGEERAYRLTSDEIVMGGSTVVHEWLATIHRDIQQRFEARNAQEGFHDLTTTAYSGYATMTACVSVGFYAPESPVERKKREKAEQTAKDLFRMVAGQEAFDKLERGESVSITGSKGTQYTLHRRASYCVERLSDGMRLCAVVPGVPLYDHLLGIKLMVEHDEAKFLKTANKAAGFTSSQTTRRRSPLWETVTTLLR